MLVQWMPQRTFDTLLLSSCIKTTLRASASGVRASWLLFISLMSTLSHNQVQEAHKPLRELSNNMRHDEVQHTASQLRSEAHLPALCCTTSYNTLKT